jgi:hypothetical protein
VKVEKKLDALNALHAQAEYHSDWTEKKGIGDIVHLNASGSVWE